MSTVPTSRSGVDEVSPALLARNPLKWFSIFGPGAIIASLTIGTGELIFSTRGGALFGYRVLFLFVLISFLKWGLVLATSRHMVLTGVHPYKRMLDLPGPRGWFLLMIFLLAAVCIPIWVSFHSSVLGNLTSWVTGTQGQLGGAIDYLWGGGILAAVLVLTATGGYSALERVQLAIVTALMFCAVISLILYKPDWLALIAGAVIPRALEYPDWLSRYGEYRQIAEQPVWVETTRYVGVIGGAGFDYLAYTSFLRETRWGRAGLTPATRSELEEVGENPSHPARLWVRAPIIDCSISFLLVIGFSAVFVASGALILGPNHKVPDENNLLNLQAELVTNLHPWLLPLYVVGAFLTMLGTLYGTLEVANSFVNEAARVVRPTLLAKTFKRLKNLTLGWCAAGAYLVLGWTFVYQMAGKDRPRIVIAILTPANLFTGVLFCGIICFLVLWMDRRFLPKSLHMGFPLMFLNLVSGVIFLALGLKGYWDDQSRWVAMGAMLAMAAVSIVVAWLLGRSGRLPSPDAGSDPR